MYFDVALLVSILFSPCILQKEKQKTLPAWEEIWDRALEREVTPYTYYSLKNLTLGRVQDYKFDYKTAEHVYRRYTVKLPKRPTWYQSSTWTWRKPLYEWSTLLMCRAHNMIYQSAYWQVRKYYPMRALYMDNLEFEVGYLVYQVVHRYQMLVELYAVANRRYYLNQDRSAAPPKYMMFIYRSMLTLSWDIIHLSNMGHEVKKKYVGHYSIFTQQDTTAIPKGETTARTKPKTKEDDLEDSGLDAAFKKQHLLTQMEKLRKKQLKKERKRQELEGMVKYVPTLEPKRPTAKRKRPFDHIYGWSIEDWWM